MSSTLSHADVSRLLIEPSTNTRVELAAKLGNELDSPRFAAHELELVQDIVRIRKRRGAPTLLICYESLLAKLRISA